MLVIVLLFILFSVLGWSFERLQGHNSCDTLLRNITGECLPILSIYGVGAIIIYALQMLNISNVMLCVLVVAFIFVYECTIGHLSKMMNKKRTWEYPESWYPMCDGYVSAVSLLSYGILGSLLALSFRFLRPI